MSSRGFAHSSFLCFLRTCHLRQEPSSHPKPGDLALCPLWPDLLGLSWEEWLCTVVGGTSVDNWGLASLSDWPLTMPGAAGPGLPSPAPGCPGHEAVRGQSHLLRSRAGPHPGHGGARLAHHLPPRPWLGAQRPHCPHPGHLSGDSSTVLQPPKLSNGCRAWHMKTVWTCLPNE